METSGAIGRDRRWHWDVGKCLRSGLWSRIGSSSFRVLLSAFPFIRDPHDVRQIPESVRDASFQSTGFCALREAIDNANSAGVDATSADCSMSTGSEIVDISLSGTIALTSSLP